MDLAVAPSFPPMCSSRAEDPPPIDTHTYTLGSDAKPTAVPDNPSSDSSCMSPSSSLFLASLMQGTDLAHTAAVGRRRIPPRT
jgi:hypothetical protein